MDILKKGVITMKEQWKKYSQKINIVALMPLAGFVIARPDVVENVIGTKYMGVIMLVSYGIMSVAGAMKQKGVTRGA